MLFSKDGRKITNGDCALFQAGDAPPFIAKISYQIVDKDGEVRLGVNWLYRPGDVKLVKIGEEEEEEVPLPPNEVFYSFHKDEIPVASLLHPCKVAFLGKGVELPSGVSSFVCRRVYDFTSKCLWWLTDRNYTNGHQEEVDDLLNKTRNEMQVTMHSGGLSPRTLNVSAQLKAVSDTIQNGSLAKGKKRDRVDQINEPLKRGRFSRPGNGDSGQLKQECDMKPEGIIDITDRDESIVNSVGVEHLVHLMQQDRKENMKKGTDSVLHRTMLVGVIATTDQEDRLHQFVHLGGLSILDDWLQEAHRGKSGDSSGPKEGEKAHEDLLLVLLQALSRLPVNLEALKTCNVGKSVNHLRNHKNLEIHKKAKCLVDTWKRRVDEELKNNDTKIGSAQGISQPSKQGLGDFVPEHGIKGVESTENNSKGLASLAPSLKVVSSRLSQEDAGKEASISPSSVKMLASCSPANSSKDSHYVMSDSGIIDLQITTTKEDKSSNPNQSQNKSQNCLVHKEDVSSSAVGSISKASHTASPHKTANKGAGGSLQSGSPKESGAKPMLLNRSTAGEKEIYVVSEKGADNTRGDGSQRLIVRLPNPLRSPARSLNCGSNADKIVPGSQGPPSDKNGRHEGKANTKIHFNISNHSSDFNTGSLQSNRTRPLSVNPIEECSCNSEDGEEFLKMTKTSQILSSGQGKREEQKEKTVEAKRQKLHESAGIAYGVVEDSSIHSKATLLASVISTEISKADDDIGAESETPLLMTGEDDLGQDTKSRCVSNKISGGLDDLVWKNALDLKKDNNDFDSMDECQNVEFTSQEQDSYNFSNRALEPQIVKEVGEGKEGSQDDMIWEVSCKRLSQGNDNGQNKMQDCMLSSQGLEQTREVFCTAVEKLDGIGEGLGLVCAQQETRVESEEHTMQKVGEAEKLEHTKLYVEDITAGVKVEQSDELCLEEDKEEIEDRNQGMVTHGYDACSRVSDSDVSKLKVDNSVIVEDSSFQARCQDPKEVGKEDVYEEMAICTKYSNKDTYDVGSHNEHPKIIDILDVKEQNCNHVDDKEDKGKDEDTDGKNLPVTRNLTSLDESQETMTKSRKYNEAEKTLASTEIQEVNQESEESGVVHNKNTTEMVCETFLDICDDKMKVDMECKLSSAPSSINLGDPLNTAIVSSTCLTHQEGHAVTPVTKSSCSDELGSSEKDIIRDVLSVKNNGSSIKDTGSICTAERPDFDLNEAIDLDGAVQHELMISTLESSLSIVHRVDASVICTASTSGLVTPITVVAASKGPFVPPVNSVRSIGELGWRGSAATSAFRPAEPRKNPKQQHLLSELVHIDAGSVIGKGSRAPLGIDLNVADEGTLEEEGMPMLLCVPMRSFQHRDMNCQDFVTPKKSESAASNGLSCRHVKPDLDLNCSEESLENGLIKSPLGKIAESFQSTAKIGTSGLSHSASRVPRNFDLNDGPCLEDTADQFKAHNSIGKGTYSLCPTSIGGMRINGAGINLSSRSSRNGVQALAMASNPSARAEHPAVAAAIPHSNLSSLSGPNFFSGRDIYRGGNISLSSEPSVSFSNTTADAYSFAGFPFGSNFPLTSASFSGGSPSYPNLLGPGCFPAISSQIVTAGPFSSSYVRPYMMNHMGASGTECSGIWPKQNLDLNTGCGVSDTDLREDRLFSRHTSLNSSVSLEHTGTFCQPSAPGVLLKRKESGEWDLHRPGCNQPWQ